MSLRISRDSSVVGALPAEAKESATETHRQEAGPVQRSAVNRFESGLLRGSNGLPSLSTNAVVLRTMPSAGYSPERLAKIAGLLGDRGLPTSLSPTEVHRAAEAKLQAFGS